MNIYEYLLLFVYEYLKEREFVNFSHLAKEKWHFCTPITPIIYYSVAPPHDPK